jgi:hypothetical protein
MMSTARLWQTKWLQLSTPLLAGLYLAGLFVFAATWSRQPSSFNSDDLYCLSFAEDLLQGRDMQGWHFTGAPFLLPDLVLLLPCQALSSNLVLVFLAYNLLIYSGLVAALAWLARLVGLGRCEAFWTACTGVLFLLVTHLDPDYGSRSELMYPPGFHVGSILDGILLTALVVHGLRFGVSVRTAVMLLALCSLSVFSDRLLIVEFLAPLFAGLGLLAVVRVVPWFRSIALGALLGSGTLLASGIRWCVPRMGLILMSNTATGLVWPRWRDVPPFIQQFFGYMAHQPLMQVLLPLYLVAGVAVVVCWLRRRPAETGRQAEAAETLDRPAVLFVASVATLAPLCNVAAVFLCTFYSAPSRYLFACWLLPFLFLGLFARMLPGRMRYWGRAGFQLAVVFLALYRIGVHGAAMDCTHFEPPYPPLAQTLDRLQRERGPMRGLAGYWVARRMNFLSRERVWVRPAGPDGEPTFHAYNPNRFLNDDPADLTLPHYNFIIVSPSEKTAPSRQYVRAEFGEPAETIVVGNDEVWLYERLSSPRFDRFLEAQLAQRMCRREKHVAPRSPAALAHPKANLMPWWSARNVQPKPGEDVEVRFERPVCGDLIDLAANYPDEYRLIFYRGEQLLETLEAPAVPWTGAVPCFYTDPGIQSRLLRLPESLRGRSFDRVLIHPIGPSTERSLGHFLLLTEG